MSWGSTLTALLTKVGKWSTTVNCMRISWLAVAQMKVQQK